MIVFHLFDKNEIVVFIDMVERGRSMTQEGAVEIANKWIFAEAAT